ncbi:MAG: helix-turn-helix domain-containing protein [Eubacteriales bacterium]|nr:helix-turn-helix domain-containing protein [Eubacteriales bacterium]
MTLLFIEDEYYTRTGILKNVPWDALGIHSVTAACQGKEGLERLSIRPDILLTDIRMPYHTGLEIAVQAKKNDPDCEVILLSSYSDKEYLLQAISLSTVAYIEKPVDMVALCCALKQAIERRKRSFTLHRISDSDTTSREVIRRLVGDQNAFSHSTRLVLEILATQYADSDLCVEKLASAVQLNPTYLSGNFKEETGCCMKRMITSIRIQEACQLLRTTNMPVTDISAKVGYLSPNYFSKLFRKEMSCAPNEYREREACGE